MSSPSFLMMQAAPADPGVAQFLFKNIAPWLFIFIVFYVLMIRPQTRRMKEHQATLAAIKKGDEVITGGGIRGKVTKVADDEVEVEIANGVRVQVVKSTITGVVTRGAPIPANS